MKNKKMVRCKNLQLPAGAIELTIEETDEFTGEGLKSIARSVKNQTARLVKEVARPITNLPNIHKNPLNSIPGIGYAKQAQSWVAGKLTSDLPEVETFDMPDSGMLGGSAPKARSRRG